MQIQEALREMRTSFLKNDDQSRLTGTIQNLIYFFNQPKVRDYVIGHHIKILPTGKQVVWDGTYFFNEKGGMDPHHHDGLEGVPLYEFLAKRRAYTGRDKARYVLSTCCVTYEGNRVHFLSLIYDRKTRTLIFFDPGIHLYEKGQDVVVPVVWDAFARNKWAGRIERLGLCSKDFKGKRWGIQYDGGSSKLPADSFCQSWTLFYLVEFLRNKCTDKFFKHWCSIPPKKREAFMLMNFFLPHIQNHAFLDDEWEKFYAEGDLTRINQHAIRVFADA